MSGAVSEEELAAKAVAPRVTLEQVRLAVSEREFIHRGMLTICVLTLYNGFTVTGESACASPENYDVEIGNRLAFENAEAKVWPLLGFKLKDNLYFAENMPKNSISFAANEEPVLLIGPTGDITYRGRKIEGDDEFRAAMLDLSKTLLSMTGRLSPIDRIAEVCHEVNRAYCEAMGDHSQKPWAEAPDWQRESARKGVRLHLFNPDAGPAASHESWMAEKEATGWKYGPVKDEAKKEHHCMVPFHQLPREQQAKDFLFRGVVHAVKDVL